jgi:hypothetical protein
MNLGNGKHLGRDLITADKEITGSCQEGLDGLEQLTMGDLPAKLAPQALNWV